MTAETTAQEIRRMRAVDNHLNRVHRAWWSWWADKLLCWMDKGSGQVLTANWVAVRKRR